MSIGGGAALWVVFPHFFDLAVMHHAGQSFFIAYIVGIYCNAWQICRPKIASGYSFPALPMELDSRFLFLLIASALDISRP